MEKKRLEFNAKLIAKMGIFTALSFALTFLEFPIFPATPFLKLDFSNVFVLIGGFSLGAVPGIIILVVKEALCLLKTTTIVGQIANVIIGLSYVLVPFLIYRFKKSFKTALITLVIGSILMSAISLPVNYYINYPFFMGSVPFVQNSLSTMMFAKTWWYVLIFNAIKAVSVSALTILLYKKVKKVLSF